MQNPWRTQSFLTTLQRGQHFGPVRLTNGENFNVTENSTQQEMASAQSRCVCTHIFMMK